MPFLLAHLPQEVFISITSLLLDANTVSQLYATGNRYLMGRLTNGGITHLKLGANEPLGRVFNFIPTLRLVSISIGESLPIVSLQALIRVLPLTLLRFEVVCFSYLSFWRLHDSPPQKTPLLPLGGLLSHYSTHSHALWRVKDSFPNLQVLKVTSNIYEDDFDIFSMVYILCGLPDTLVDLSLCFLDDCGFDYYSLLPPNLERLSFGRRSTLVIPTQRHEHLLLHLTSLHLKISRDESYFLLDPIPEGALGSWRQPSLEDSVPLWLPPTLSVLDLTFEHDQTALLRGLPTSLTQLTLRECAIGNMHDNDLFMALDCVPPSVTFLRLKEFNIMPSHSDSSDGQQDHSSSEVAKLPSLKRFRFSGDPPPSTLMRLVKWMPSCIEEFRLKLQSNRHTRLTLEMLTQFDARRLRTLVAPLANECFSHGDGSLLLTSMLPQLRKLHLTNEELENDFNFASIPPTVTEFSADHNLSSKYLHQLPSSVTRLSMPRLEVCAEGEYLTLISTGFTHPEEVLRLNYPLMGDVYRSYGAITAPLYSGKLSWPRNIDFPRTVTELSIDVSYLMKPSFSPENLPHLKNLTCYYRYLIQPESKALIGAFKTLEDLNAQFLNPCDACPPNLTRLVTKSEIPGHFERLPASLTHLECSGQPESLYQLRSLKVFKGSAFGPLWFCQHLTTTITSITVQGSCMHSCSRDEMESFFKHLSSLEHLAFDGVIALPVLELVLQAKPSHVSLKVHDIESTIERAEAISGIGPGQLPCYPGDKKDDWHRRMGLAVCNALLPKLQIKGSFRFEATDFAFLPYLPSSLKELELDDLPHSLLKDIPWPNLTSLVCVQFFSSLYEKRDLCFPASLLKLTIGASITCNRHLLASLPLSLTHLEIPYGEVVDVFDSWPPRLAHLSVSFDEESIEQNLQALPTSLRYLELRNDFDASLLPAIPAHVVALKVRFQDVVFLEVLEYTMRRGTLTWIAPEDQIVEFIDELSPHLEFDSLLDESVIRLRNGMPTVQTDVDGEEDAADDMQETLQINSSNSSIDAVNVIQPDYDYELPMPTQRSKRSRDFSAE